MLYRIITENIMVNESEICKMTSNYFPSFTLYDAWGYCKGVREYCLIIEISTNSPITFDGETRDDAIKELCSNIRELNDQDCVLLQQIECKETFI